MMLPDPQDGCVCSPNDAPFLVERGQTIQKMIGEGKTLSTAFRIVLKVLTHRVLIKYPVSIVFKGMFFKTKFSLQCLRC